MPDKSAASKRPEFVLRDDRTGEFFTLGPMYSGTDEYVIEKLRSEDLQYPWTLFKLVEQGGPRLVGC